jgi:tetratricopeptide (TPR) repeat protein
MKIINAVVVSIISICAPIACFAAEPDLKPAAELLKNKDYPGAIKFLDNCIKTNPKNEEAYFMRSSALARSGQKEKAQADLLKLKELNPKLYEALVGFSHKLKDARKSIYKNPDKPIPSVEMRRGAQAAIDAKDYKKALSLYDKIIPMLAGERDLYTDKTYSYMVEAQCFENRSKVHEALGHKPLAQKDALEAKKLMKECPESNIKALAGAKP